MQDKVEWRKIEGKKWYEVSSTGLVRVLLDKPYMLTLKRHSSYLYVTLTDDVTKRRKNYFVHRLVAETFLSKPDIDYLVVNHKNGIKTDNRVENLEWCTQAENVKHSYRMGLQKVDSFCKAVKQIDVKTGEVIKIYKSATEASMALFGDKHGCQNIGRVCNKKKHYHKMYGYKWEWA